MSEYVLPPLAAVLLWWLGTGAVIVLDRQPRDTRGCIFFFATLLMGMALLLIGQTARLDTAFAAYAGFAATVALWGWHELAFLGGWITGPRRDAITPGARGWQRLREAVQVLLWHEIALVATLLALWVAVGTQANPVAAWTFTLLWVMRVSAKLNLFLGVRNLALEFLPPRLEYLGTYFRQRRFNALMPVSLLAGGVAVAWLLAAATGDGTGSGGAARVSLLLVASLLALALVEHLMMVLPLQPTALWRWALKRDALAAR
jgi:putative photosynthetic complex assembly protein 2